MITIAVIPARMGSSRFPGKPMAKILGMPMIGHCYKRAEMSELIDGSSSLFVENRKVIIFIIFRT